MIGMVNEGRFSACRAMLLNVVLAIGFLSGTSAVATDYYVSSGGNDSNNGTSPSTAWRTISKVNNVNFLAGDRIFFEGGQTFAGGLTFTSADSGTASSPVVVGSYGSGRATIQSSTTSGFSGNKVSGIEIRDLIFQGPGAATSNSIGLYFQTNNGTMNYFRIDHVEVSGFKEGCQFSPGGNSSYQDIRVTHSDFHNNRLVGLQTYAYPRVGAIKDIYVGYCRFYSNRGDPDYTSHSGSGIVLGQVDGGVIERCTAFGNGDLGFGSVGIWSWGSNDVTIQFCESYSNRTGGSSDGGGFDLDGAQTNSVIQYNYSHDNDGAGYLLAQWNGALPMANNVFRYNISQNDGRRNSYGGITIWSGDDDPADGATFHNNVIVVSPVAGGQPPAVRLMNAHHANILMVNNIFITSGGVPLVSGNSAVEKLLFAGNAYWTGNDNFRIYYNGANYASLEAWRAATGQEMLNGNPVGFKLDPELLEVFNGGTIGNPDLLAAMLAYRQAWNSPMRDAGLDLAGIFGISPGSQDFYGNPLPQGKGLDIGVYEAEYGGNDAPSVYAGVDQTVRTPANQVVLSGTVTDDGNPDPPGELTFVWSKISGPGGVVFAEPSSSSTTATFQTYGTYVLRLTADDGEFQRYDELTVVYESVPYLWYTPADLSGGLTGWMFYLANDDGLLTSYTVEMAFEGEEGATIRQQRFMDLIDVHSEDNATDWDGLGEPPYSKTLDSWIYSPFAENPIAGTHPLTGAPLNGIVEAPNVYAMSCYSGPGSQLGDGVNLAYIVADGNVRWTGTIRRSGVAYSSEGVTEGAVVLIAGDYNGDGYVDLADYTVWADHYGQSGSDLPGDGNGDGVVDLADYTVWADHFGQGTPPAN